MAAAEWFLTVLTVYTALGVLFAVAFVTRGVSRIDPVAQGSKAGFRLMIFPGVAALWPVLFVKWIRVVRRQV